MSLEERYREVQKRVAGRARLIAVSKAATLDATRTLYDLGQRDLAENRAASLAEKARALPPDVRWHFIGNLQSRDLRILRDVKPLVHSFDRPDLVAKWPPDVPILLQVDFTGRADRNGLAPDAIPATLAAARAAGLDVRGLSTLPPDGEDPRPYFASLRKLRDEHALADLSMGMSDDLETAIQEGATMVRVGRAIFGHHP